MNFAWLKLKAKHYAWKCNNCQTEFLALIKDRIKGDNHSGATCPHCKAYGQYTYRVKK